MSDAELIEELQRFIARYIESVEKLEILLMLKRSPAKSWSVQEVYQQIQSSINSVNQKLLDLCRDGFVKRGPDERFQFSPKSKELEEKVAALGDAYQKRRIKVIELIFSSTTDELRKFADAFKLRKENE